MKLSLIAVIVGSAIVGGCANKNTSTVIPAVAPSVVAQSLVTTTTLAKEGRDPSQFPAYVERLKAQARSEGVSESTIDIAFANVHFVDRVIKSDRNQLEKRITLNDYLNRVLPAWKIKQGKAFYQRYQKELSQVTARYGVPERYIIALWGMESSFGKIQGNEDVISALSTLAFEGRRVAFFTKELIAALKIIQQGHAPIGQLKGSWAGAMGQSQFMPSSFLKYGADGDGDGKIDIWNNINDVFASTANYLSSQGWQTGIEWGQEIRLPKNFNTVQAGLQHNQSRSVIQWQQLGITVIDGATFPNNNQRAWVIIPDNMQGRAFLVYDNFRTIMHWNRSYYFAISIGMMADGIGQ